MEPTRGSSAPRDTLTDDAVVAYLRTRAPGVPAVRFDPGAVTARARGALRRRRRRNRLVAAAGAATACLALLAALPLPGPGHVWGDGAAPDRQQAQVDRLDAEVVPVVQNLQIYYYLLQPGPCRVLEYHRGAFRDGSRECGDLVPFDAAARADFDAVTEAVERSGVPVERIFRTTGIRIHVQLKDRSWRYNWEYVYMPDVASPPPASSTGEEWTHIRDDWWLHRAHDD